MTKKSVGYVHLEWECPACSTRNKGIDKICRNCAAAQPTDVKFEQVAQEALIEDEKLIAQAKSGADVHCGFCGTRNVATASHCSQCMAELNEGTIRESGQVIGAHQQGPVADVICSHCSTANPGTAQNCSQCGAALPKLEKSTRPQAKQKEKRPSSPISRFVMMAVLGLVVVGCIALVVLSRRTEDVVGEVQAVNWEYSLVVEALQPVQDEAWRDELPTNAENLSCREEVRQVQSEPAPNSVEVCGTPYTVDTGTGVGEVVQDCEYEVYDDLCSFTVLAWREFDTVSLSGDDLAPEWPTPTLAQDQREGKRTESYEVVFNADGRSYTYYPNSLNEYGRFADSSRWILQVNTFNNVLSLEAER